jgi:hypothetical protein
MAQYKFTYEAADADEAQKKANALSVLASKIPVDDLMFIAGKVNRDPKGLMDKLHKYKAFI